MANYNYQVVVTAHQHLMTSVTNNIDDVQGQPAGSKHHYNGDQHCVDPLVLIELALSFPLSVFLFISPVEADHSLQVADEVEAQRTKYWTINMKMVKMSCFIVEGQVSL